MRSKLIAGCLAGAMALAVSGCGSSSGDSGGNDTIKLGAWLSLTGPLAQVGVPMEAGSKAAFGEINAGGGISGKKVKWTALDNAYDPQQTIQVARKLIGQDGAIAIVGATGTAQSEAAFPYVLQQSKVPILGPYAGLETWYNPPKAGLFGTFPVNEDGARASARWMIDDKLKKVTILRSDPDSFAVAASAAEAVFKKAGVEVKSVVTKIGTTDYGPIVPKVKAQSPEGVLTLLTASEAAAYLNAAALQGDQLPTYAYAVTTSSQLPELAGKNAEGFHGLSPTLPPTSDDPAVKKYREAMAKYAPKAKPDFYSIAMYAYAKAFAEVAKTIDGPITSASLVKAYKKADNIKTGLTGPMDFTDNQLGTHELVRVQVKDGQWVQQGDFVDGAE